MNRETNMFKSKLVSDKQIKDYLDTVGGETVADIALTITERLHEACAHVGDVFCEMEQKFPEIMTVMGFSAIATCNALPLEIDHTPVCVVVGTASGIQHAAQPLIEAFSKISKEARHDRETRG